MRDHRKTAAIRTICGNVVRFTLSLVLLSANFENGGPDESSIVVDSAAQFGVEDDLCFGIFLGAFEASENRAARTSFLSNFVET
jgi:hypothetical protein